jgi:nucleoside-diphosphate-sugar epimerase
MRVLLTGGTGFVGVPLCEALAGAACVVRVALRKAMPLPAGAAESAVVGDISSRTEWGEALANVDVVVHAAARAHVLHDSPQNEDLYFETNARGTERLARDAACAGVRRMVFLSSIKVNGEATSSQPYRALDEPRPQDAYGRSKLAAESSVREAGAASSMQTVIVRPPLVYGPGVKANFLRLLDWVWHGRPIPLGMVRNTRSLISVWNLCDFIVLASRHPDAASDTWLVSDGEDLSTAMLVSRIGRAMGKSVRLVPVPPALLLLAGSALGRRSEVQRLCGSLAVDASPADLRLGWRPPLTLDQSLARTAAWYIAGKATHAG